MLLLVLRIALNTDTILPASAASSCALKATTQQLLLLLLLLLYHYLLSLLVPFVPFNLLDAYDTA